MKIKDSLEKIAKTGKALSKVIDKDFIVDWIPGSMAYIGLLGKGTWMPKSEIKPRTRIYDFVNTRYQTYSAIGIGFGILGGLICLGELSFTGDLTTKEIADTYKIIKQGVETLVAPAVFLDFFHVAFKLGYEMKKNDRSYWFERK